MSKKFRIKTLYEFVNENLDERYTATIGLKKNKWEDIDPSEHPDELADELYDLIQLAYAPIGGHAKINKPSDVFAEPKWNAWKVIDVDADPEADVVIFGQKTKYGTKSSGVGHDGGKQAKRAYLDDKGKSFNTKGYYGEVSSKFAEIMLKKYKVPTVDDKDTVEKVINKKVEWHGEHPTDKSMPGKGWYSRKIGGTMHAKILVGRPKV